MTPGRNAALAMDGMIEPDFDESRRSPRTVISLRARLRLPDGGILDGHTADISETGIGFFSTRMLPSDQDCRVFLDLSACGTDLELSLTGRICYCHEDSSGRFRVGMRFVGLESEAAALLAAMLR